MTRRPDPGCPGRRRGPTLPAVSDAVLRLLIALVLIAVAVGVAAVARRRRPDPPTAPSYRAPIQLDRDDFDGVTEPGLLVMFGSTTCDSCRGAWETVSGLGRPGLAVQRIDVEDDASLHQRYKIDGVPTTVLAGDDGVVHSTWFGPVDRDELIAAIGGRDWDQTSG